MKEEEEKEKKKKREYEGNILMVSLLLRKKTGLTLRSDDGGR